MRIQKGNTTSKVGKSASGSRSQSASGTFTLPQQTEESAQAQQAYQTSALQDVSSLLALQGVEDSLTGRRRKAVRRGGKMLDLLEEIRLGLLTGNLSLAVLRQLEQLVMETEESGDERIDALLSEIGLRAQVEIAKLEGQKSVSK